MVNPGKRDATSGRPGDRSSDRPPDRPGDDYGDTIRLALADSIQQAWAFGHDTVGTEHLLAHLLKRVYVTGVPLPQLRHAVGQRLTAGTGWASHDADPGRAGSARSVFGPESIELTRLLREAAWKARRGLGKALDDPEPVLSPAARSALSRARDEAGRFSARWAHRLHLLAAILADPENRAAELLAASSVEPDRLLAEPVAGLRLADSDQPVAPGATDLRLFDIVARDRGLTGNASTKDMSGRAVSIQDGRSMGRGLRTLLLLRGAVPVLDAIEREAMRQAVRLGQRRTGPAHLLLAIAAIERQLTDCGWSFRGPFVADNRAGALLAEAGVGYPALVDSALADPAPVDPTTASRTTGGRPGAEPADPGHPGPRRPWNPAIDSNAAAVLARARGLAPRGRRAGTNHGLRALIAEPAGAELILAHGLEPAALDRRLTPDPPSR